MRKGLVMNYLDVTAWGGGRKAIFYILIAMCGVGYVVGSSDPSDEPISFGQLLMVLGFIYLCCAFIGRNSGNADIGYNDRDREIDRLQRKLSDAAYSLSQAEARGDHGRAAQFRAMVHEYESRLRRLGA